MMRRLNVAMIVAFLVFSTLPASSSNLEPESEVYLSEIPKVKTNEWRESSWWETTVRDLNRNGIVDWLEPLEDEYQVGVSFVSEPTDEDLQALVDLGLEVRYHLTSVNALLLGFVEPDLYPQISQFPGVVMVEPYGSVVFYGDVQTPAVKASNSSVYPEGAWDLGFTGKGVNIAIVDTGIDNEHPGLEGKFVAGFDAVCTDDPLCLASLQEDDGSFDPDDQNQHGTACSGMATSTGLLSGGEKTNFTGAAPDAKLVDVRIGTALGAGPFENYILEQEFYESAMNGIQWVIDNKDTAWPGAENESYGIDVISLSWGITSHEDGGSDGTEFENCPEIFTSMISQGLFALQVKVPVHIVGYSMGGIIASEYCKIFPHLVKSLILIAPAGINVDVPFAVRWGSFYPVGEIFVGLAGYILLKRHYKQCSGKTIKSEINVRKYHCNLKAYYSSLLCSIRNMPWETYDFTDIKTPKYLIYSSSDEIITFTKDDIAKFGNLDYEEVHGYTHSKLICKEVGEKISKYIEEQVN